MLRFGKFGPLLGAAMKAWQCMEYGTFWYGQALVFLIIIFWAIQTFSIGISMPRSPRATIMPSDSARILGAASPFKGAHVPQEPYEALPGRTEQATTLGQRLLKVPQNGSIIE